MCISHGELGLLMACLVHMNCNSFPTLFKQPKFHCLVGGNCNFSPTMELKFVTTPLEIEIQWKMGRKKSLCGQICPCSIFPFIITQWHLSLYITFSLSIPSNSNFCLPNNRIWIPTLFSLYSFPTELQIFLPISLFPTKRPVRVVGERL